MDTRLDNLWTKLVLLSVVGAPLFAQTPTVFIDGPLQGSTVSGVVTVSGWAVDSVQNFGTVIQSVVIQVDGTPVGAASLGISRPDVCAQFPGRAGCPNVGWAYSLNTASLAAGAHTITAVATDTDPIPTTGSATVQVSVGAPSNMTSPLVFIDSPTAGSPVGGTITVTVVVADPESGVGSESVAFTVI